MGRSEYSSLQASQGDTRPCSRRLIHLAEHEGNLGLAIELDDLCLLHFMVQIVTLTGSLPDTSEHREATVRLGNVVLQQH